MASAGDIKQAASSLSSTNDDKTTLLELTVKKLIEGQETLGWRVTTLEILNRDKLNALNKNTKIINTTTNTTHPSNDRIVLLALSIKKLVEEQKKLNERIVMLELVNKNELNASNDIKQESSSLTPTNDVLIVYLELMVEEQNTLSARVLALEMVNKDGLNALIVYAGVLNETTDKIQKRVASGESFRW